MVIIIPWQRHGHTLVLWKQGMGIASETPKLSTATQAFSKNYGKIFRFKIKLTLIFCDNVTGHTLVIIVGKLVFRSWHFSALAPHSKKQCLIGKSSASVERTAAHSKKVGIPPTRGSQSRNSCSFLYLKPIFVSNIVWKLLDGLIGFL